jgi:hypothetical protein
MAMRNSALRKELRGKFTWRRFPQTGNRKLGGKIQKFAVDYGNPGCVLHSE